MYDRDRRIEMIQERIILKTAIAMLVLLLFFFAQGAIVVITGIDGMEYLQDVPWY